MKMQRFVPLLAMITGIALPSVFTVIFLSRVAVTPAAAPLPKTGTHKKRPTPTGTPTPTTGTGKSGTFTGAAVQGFFGPVQATLTVSAGKITNVGITAPQDNPTSQYINAQAVPLLKSETLQAQSARINGISGATVTSQAYYQSLVGALKSARL